MGELPLRVSLGAAERLVAARKAARLEWPRFRLAVDAHDAAAGALDHAPLALAGHRVAVHLAQVALHYRPALVLEQVVERLGVGLGAARRALVVRADRVADLVTREQQLRFLLALLAVRSELADRRQHAADDSDADQQRDVRESVLENRSLAPISPTRPHSPSRCCARRRRRLS